MRMRAGRDHRFPRACASMDKHVPHLQLRDNGIHLVRLWMVNPVEFCPDVIP
jgi:hypothetical protein